MKKIFIITLAALALSACTDYFDEHLLENNNTQITDIRTGMTYTLVDADYKAVARNATNIAKALALDPKDSTALKELQAIEKEKSFTETASADMYLPAFLVDKFPYLDNGTICDVLYTMREGKSQRVQEFVGAQGFTLTQDDYETIWNKRGASYVTPTTKPNIPAFLSTKLSTATEGQIALISYQFCEDEPDSADLSDFLPYELNLSELLVFPDKKRHKIHGLVGTVKSSLNGRFYMVVGNDSIYVYGLSDEDG